MLPYPRRLQDGSAEFGYGPLVFSMPDFLTLRKNLMEKYYLKMDIRFLDCGSIIKVRNVHPRSSLYTIFRFQEPSISSRRS